MAKRSATTCKTRDPKPKTRDPAVKGRDAQAAHRATTRTIPRRPRRYIPASMPTLCPDCGHGTRMADGRHVDPVRKTVLEYRTCGHCGVKLAAGRDMHPREIEKYCGYAESVEEYESTLIRD